MSTKILLVLVLGWNATLMLVPSGVGAFVPSFLLGRTRIPKTKVAALQATKTTVIAGPTGYIGKHVVRESVRQGYRTVALIRDASRLQTTEGKEKYGVYLAGAELVECDVTDQSSLEKAFQQIASSCENQRIDSVISCLASRSGYKTDSFRIDYQATLNCLEAGRACNARHFVLLSAFCVQKPLLQFQHAKLKFEAALRKQKDMTYSIVRPTAFFKSVSVQLEVIQSGLPFITFGKRGAATRCNPIAESDLAMYLVDCVKIPERTNKILNLGGPDDPITKKMQGNMLFEAAGIEPRFINVPLEILDFIINVSQFLADITGSETFEDAAETARISKYYTIEDMLTTREEEKFGTIRLKEHYRRIAKEGQDYDPYVSIVAQMRGVDVEGMAQKRKAQALPEAVK